MYSTFDGSDIVAIGKRGENEIEHERSDLIYGAYAPFYMIYNEQFVARDAAVVAQIIADRAAAVAAEKARLEAIDDAQETEGLKEYTVEQATNYVDDQLDTTDLDALGPDIAAISNLTEAKVVITDLATELRSLHKNTETILKKVMPYLLG